MPLPVNPSVIVVSVLQVSDIVKEIYGMSPAAVVETAHRCPLTGGLRETGCNEGL
jgi:hypothetical protein